MSTFSQVDLKEKVHFTVVFPHIKLKESHICFLATPDKGLSKSSDTFHIFQLELKSNYYFVREKSIFFIFYMF